MEAIKQVELFDNLFFISMGMAIVGLILAIFFFAFFDIPTVFSLITGRGKKRALERMRNQSESGKSIREKASSSSQLKQSAARIGESDDLNTVQTAPAAAPADMMDTQPLSKENQTTLLRPEKQENTILQPEKADTTVLNQDMIRAPRQEEETVGATEILSGGVHGPDIAGLNFAVTEEILYIHTDEFI